MGSVQDITVCPQCGKETLITGRMKNTLFVVLADTNVSITVSGLTLIT